MNKKYDLPELDDLPEDFDPLEMAAFLDGEANTKLVRGLTESSAMRAVAAAGLDTGLIADVEASEALAARAEPLAKRSGLVGTDSPGFLARVTTWLGADWRAATAGVVLGVFGFGAGLAGGLGLGETGLSAEDILVSASVSDVFAFDTSTEATDLIQSDAFDAVFGSIE